MKLNLNRVELRMSAGTIKQFPSAPIPQIAFSGRSNVGKSSLINCLLGRKSLARVSSAPGKTITINFYEIDKSLFFVDLPGYGYAKRSADSKQVWSGLTNSYFVGNPNADRIKLVVQLVDSRIGPTEDDHMMIEWMLNNNVPFLVVLTKTDKLNKTQRNEIIDYMNNDYFRDFDIPVIPFSSQSGEGKQALWDAILLAIQK